MKKLLPMVGLLALALPLMAMLSPSAVVSSSLQSRTPDQLQLFHLLNGERERPVQSDGGGLLLFVNDGGLATATVSGGSVYYFENTGTVGCHLCTPQPDQATWDGGCNSTVANPNYGKWVDAGSGTIISTRDSTTLIKAIPVAGGLSCTMPGWIMR